MEEKKKKGRPTRYNQKFNEQAYKLCQLGATDDDLADFFGVTYQTINNWKKKHPAFFASIKESKDDKDSRVERSLYERAMGYEHPEEKIFCNQHGEVTKVETVKKYAPSETAMIFWLKNRQPKKWRDKQEIEHSGSVNIITDTDDSNL